MGGARVYVVAYIILVSGPLGLWAYWDESKEMTLKVENFTMKEKATSETDVTIDFYLATEKLKRKNGFDFPNLSKIRWWGDILPLTVWLQLIPQDAVIWEDKDKDNQLEQTEHKVAHRSNCHE